MKRKAVAVLVVVGLLAFAQSLSAQEKEKQKKKGRGPAGTVKSVNADKGEIVVAVRRGKGTEAEDRTFKLAKEVKVTINGESKTLADVKEGMLVFLTVANDEVTEIRSGRGKKKDNA